MTEITQGIIAGLATYIVLQGIVLFYKQIFTPRFQSYIYKGVDVSGEWIYQTRTPAETEADVLVHIEQSASNLTLTLTGNLKRKGVDKPEQRIFKGKGTINDRLISFSVRNINRRQIGERVYLLEVIKGGEELKGTESWFSFLESEVRSQECILERKV